MPEPRTAVEGECRTDHPSVRIAIIRRAVVIVVSVIVGRSIVGWGVAAVVAIVRAICVGAGGQTADHRSCYQSAGKSRTETVTEMPGLRGSGRRHRGQANSGSGSQCHCCFSHAVLLYFSEEWECLLMSTRRKELPQNRRPEALLARFNLDEKLFS